MTAESADGAAFETALYNVCRYLAREIARDGEGATKLVEVTVSGVKPPGNLIEAYAGRPEAAATMRDVLVKLAGSPRLTFIARAVLAWLALEARDLTEATAHAEAAATLAVVSPSLMSMVTVAGALEARPSLAM